MREINYNRAATKGQPGTGKKKHRRASAAVRLWKESPAQEAIHEVNYNRAATEG